jgi:hypothetical protein
VTVSVLARSARAIRNRSETLEGNVIEPPKDFASMNERVRRTAQERESVAIECERIAA